MFMSSAFRGPSLSKIQNNKNEVFNILLVDNPQFFKLTQTWLENYYVSKKKLVPILSQFLTFCLFARAITFIYATHCYHYTSASHPASKSFFF